MTALRSIFVELIDGISRWIVLIAAVCMLDHVCWISLAEHAVGSVVFLGGCGLSLH